MIFCEIVTAMRSTDACKKIMKASKCGYCVCCKRSRSSRWYPLSDNTRPYVVDTAAKKGVRPNMVCALCTRRLKANQPSVKRSTIPKAGNGLFADRDYKWGETVTYYSGKVYTDRRDVPASPYILFRAGFFIDGRVDFDGSLGRYINAAKGRKHPNVYFGYQKIGTAVPIKVLTKAMARQKKMSVNGEYGLRKGEELFIKYGSGYWRKSK